MKQKTLTQQLAAFMLVMLLAIIPAYAQQQVETAKKDANLFLTNSEGEKVFSYNNKETLYVKLVATYLDTDPNSKQSVGVTVGSDMEPEGEILLLEETGNNSGVFMGGLKFKKSPMPFKNSKFLEVENGDKITATYLIAKNEQGVEDRVFDNAYYDGPNWVFQNTGENHIVLLPPNIKITIDGEPAAPGIFVSVFYEKKKGDKVVLENAGGTGRGIAPGGVRWMGKVTTIAAWGAQDGKNNGLAEGEKLKWKIWNPKDGREYDAVATYMISDSHITHTDKYTNNGISGILSLEAKSKE
ncbi:MAG: hypothetical protein U9R19_01995 [Bacteroidota bacterium]|nr:hypothetical protein [Bacteroidota bacterium]